MLQDCIGVLTYNAAWPGRIKNISKISRLKAQKTMPENMLFRHCFYLVFFKNYPIVLSNIS